ncbi:MAG TPA: helix-hairpin-helix domain-containing protein [Cytophagaceae bacterium]|nr:helix-hairpin-helix domain-containing protein [Cytophagaceae bacterium]
MKIVYCLFLIFIFMICSQASYAQSPPVPDIDLDNFIQELFQLQDKDVNYEDIYESLLQFYTNPLDLNSAEREDLQALYILNDVQINQLFKYREQTGNLISLYELQVIPGFDMVTINKLLPFVEIKQNTENFQKLWTRMWKDHNSYLLVRTSRVLQSKAGDQGAYAGSPDNLYMRFRNSHSKDYSIGFTLEQDAGEKILWSPSTHRYITDFYSFHCTLFNKGKFKAVSLGDYQVQFGQGLILSSGFSIGKGAETILTTRRSNAGIRPFTSAMETGFFRGAAATYRIKDFELSAFYSNKDIDGKINTDTLNNYNEFVSSLQSTGYHRTASEIAAKHQINEQNVGGNISFNKPAKNLHLGASMIETHYSKALIRSPSVYNQFAFRGKDNLNVSADYNLLWQNFNFFGEAALSGNGGKALVSGLMASLSSRTEISMVYRNYERDFQSSYGNAFGENTTNNNEKGIYWGVKIKPFRQWTLSAYYDRFIFPWLKYQTYAPSKGYEYLARLNYQPSKHIAMYIQIRSERKEKNQSGNTTNIDFLMPYTRNNYMINLDYKTTEKMVLRTRVQASSYRQSKATTYGYYIMEEVSFDFSVFKISGRYAIFDTDDYDNRQYAYERDVLYVFSIPALSGRGTRFYLLSQMRINRSTDIWFRYARTKYSDRQVIASGPEQINGNAKSELKFEIRYRF